MKKLIFLFCCVISLISTPVFAQTDLFVSDTLLNFNPTTDTLKLFVHNSGTDTLFWKVNADTLINWLDIFPDSGMTTTEKDTITIAVKRDSLLPGIYTTQIKIMCSTGDSAIINVKMKINAPPSIINHIPDTTLTLYFDTLKIDLNTVFTDPDSDSLTFSYLCKDGTRVKSSISKDTLIIIPVDSGETDIFVTADDKQGGPVTDTFKVTVKSFPIDAKEIGDTTITIGIDTLIIKLDTIFSHSKGEMLTFDPAISDSALASLKLINYNTLQIIPESGGITIITIKATDSKNIWKKISFNLTINTIPTINQNIIPDTLFLTEGNSGFRQNLNEIFIDPDGDSLIFSRPDSGDTDIALVSILEDTIITVTPIGRGITQFIIFADDQKGGKVSNTTIVHVNGRPIINKPIDKMTLVIDFDTLRLDLKTVFTDPDLDPLQFTYRCDNDKIIKASILNDILTIIPVDSGKTKFWIEADDQKGGVAIDSFFVTVKLFPIIYNEFKIPILTIGVHDYKKNLDSVFTHRNGLKIKYSAIISNKLIATVDTSEEPYLKISPIKGGQDTITIKAIDPDSVWKKISLELVVNTRPEIKNPLPDSLKLHEGFSIFNQNLHDVFFDPDSDKLSFFATSKFDNIAIASVIDDTLLKVTPLGTGKTQLKIEAKDGRGGVISDSLLVNVNGAPKAEKPFPKSIMLYINQKREIRIDSTFKDPENSNILFYTLSTEPSIVLTEIRDTKLIITGIKKGQAQVMLVVKDNEGAQTTYTIQIEVKGAPDIIKGISDTTLTIEQDILKINLSNHFSHPDSISLDIKCEYDTTFLKIDYDTTMLPKNLTNNIVKITPQKVTDSTNIKIIASDGIRSNSLKFWVTVNQKPQIQDSLSDTVLTIGAKIFKKDLKEVFIDAKDPTLSFSVENSDKIVAEAIIFQDTLKITPQKKGTIKITLHAEDNLKGKNSTFFIVTVNSPPQITEYGNNISPIKLTDLDTIYSFCLDSTFFDPDTNKLFFSFQIGDTALVNADTSTKIISVNRKSKSSQRHYTDITLTAADSSGGKTSEKFNIEVNFFPVIKNKTILDSTIFISDQKPTISLNLNDVFDDPDGDVLKYRVIVPKIAIDDTIITASIQNESSLLISLVKPSLDDSVILSILAEDSLGGKVSGFTKIFTDKAPQISIPEISPWNPSKGDTVKIKTFIADKNITTVEIEWRRAGEKKFNPNRMINSPLTTSDLNRNIYLHNSIVQSSSGIEFRIKAEDAMKNVSYMPYNQNERISIPCSFLANELKYPTEKDSFLISGTEENAYRLISFPLILNNNNAKAVLEDDLGSYNDTRWRFSELNSTDSNEVELYTEINDTMSIIPGKAYWIINKILNKTIKIGPGVTYLTSSEFSIQLQRGWNLIGNPFNFSIPIKNIYTKDSSNHVSYKYEGTWIKLTNEASLDPFHGIAVYSEKLDNLYINPDLTYKDKSNFSELTFLKDIADTKSLEYKMKIEIMAQCRLAQDVENIAAIAPGSSSDWDVYDSPEPPVIGNYISVYFYHPEWKKFTSRYSADIRPELNKGEIWDIAVRTNIHDKAKLTINGIENIPSEYEVWLLDNNLKIPQNLRKSPVYFLAGPTDSHPKTLKLIIGLADFINQEIHSTSLIPDEFVLLPNFPNPFNPATTIKYGLPLESTVSLKIYNLMGQEVAVLINNEKQNAGYHDVVWDSRNFSGVPVTSGLYIYILQTEKLSIKKKMLLIK